MESKIYKQFIWLGISIILITSPILHGSVRICFYMPVMAIIGVLVFVWLFRLLNLGNHKVKQTSIDKLIVLFAVLALLSFYFSIYKAGSFYSFIKLSGYIGAFYLVVNNFNRVMIKRLITLVIFIGVFLSLYGVLQYFGLLPHPWWIPQRFLASVYVNHNHFAGYLELIIPAAIGFMLNDENKNVYLKLISSSFLIIMIIAFILTQSRGAWICLTVSMFIMSIVLVKSKIINKRTLIALFLLVVIVLSVICYSRTEVFTRFNTITGVEVGEASLSTRFKIWEGTIELIKDNLLMGTGIGTFSWAFPSYRPEGLIVKANFTHNDFLQTAAEMGIFGLLIMMLILFRIILTGLIKGSADLVVLGCTVGVLSLTLHGLIDFNFHITANVLLFVIYSAIIVGNDEKG